MSKPNQKERPVIKDINTLLLYLKDPLFLIDGKTAKGNKWVEQTCIINIQRDLVLKVMSDIMKNVKGEQRFCHDGVLYEYELSNPKIRTKISVGIFNDGRITVIKCIDM